MSNILLHDYFAAHCDVSVYRPKETLEARLGRPPTVAELADYIAQIRCLEADAMLGRTPTTNLDTVQAART